jgi:Rrf2 family protein
MDIIRRNTDYTLRAVVNLAEHYGKSSLSTRQIAIEGDISYQLTCKLMQKLLNSKLVCSSMGPKGGYRLARKPSKINLLELITATQGPLRLNRCLLGVNRCPRRPKCMVAGKLAGLQKLIEKYLRGITLEQIANIQSVKRRKDGQKL